jgi:hypothetical protein
MTRFGLHRRPLFEPQKEHLGPKDSGSKDNVYSYPAYLLLI